MRSKARVLAFAVVPLFAWSACSSSSDDKRDGSVDSPPAASGGHTSAGGQLGTGGGSGGALGSGGASALGGALGSGGTTRMDGGGSGGLSGTGGRATGGAAGGGGAGGTDTARPDGAVDLVIADARSEDARDAIADATAEVGGADSPPDLPIGTDGTLADGNSSGTLESCFVGLPAQVGVQMIATKSTADGRIRMRIALDTEDRMGTSGTYGWGIIRVAVEVDGVVTCITDRSVTRYTGSHHNCSDTATATSGATTYLFAAPDRPVVTLTIDNGTPAGPYTLTDTTCTMSWSPGVPITCRSGGSC